MPRPNRTGRTSPYRGSFAPSTKGSNRICRVLAERGDRLGQPDSYYRAYLADYRQRRDYLVASLQGAGFGCQPPAGAYYIMADIGGFDFADDVALAQYLVRERGLAVVSGTSFYPPPTRPDHRRPGSQRVRFSFPKRMDTLQRAAARLADLPRSSG